MVDVAVCMATYNGARYLGCQIDSVVKQLGPRDVLYISDDGSSDSTVDIINSYGSGVRLVASSRAGGVVRNFERVLAAAYSDGANVIVLADQDDKWFDGRMEIIRSELERNDLLMMNGLVTDSQLLDSGKTVFDAVGFRRGFFANALRPSYVGCCMAFRRDLLGLVLPFPRFLPWHDWYISLIGEIYFGVKIVDLPTIYYRRHDLNFSNTGGKSSNGFLVKLYLRLTVLLCVFVAVLRRLRGYVADSGRG